MNINPQLQAYLNKGEASEGPTTQTLQAKLAAQNQITKCEVCGSDWFYVVDFEQYQNMYSASAGGNLHAVSDMAHKLLICPCGNPISPNIGGTKGGRTPNLGLNSFLTALTAAKESRALPMKMIQDIAAASISKDDLNAVRDKLAELDQQVGDLVKLSDGVPGLGPIPAIEGESLQTLEQKVTELNSEFNRGLIEDVEREQLLQDKVAQLERRIQSLEEAAAAAPPAEAPVKPKKTRHLSEATRKKFSERGKKLAELNKRKALDESVQPEAPAAAEPVSEPAVPEPGETKEGPDDSDAAF